MTTHPNALSPKTIAALMASGSIRIRQSKLEQRKIEGYKPKMPKRPGTKWGWMNGMNLGEVREIPIARNEQIEAVRINIHRAASHRGIRVSTTSRKTYLIVTRIK